MAYSMDFRRRVLDVHHDEGLNIQQTADRFRLSWDTVRTWLDRARRGRLEPDRPGPKGPRTVTEQDRAALRQMVEDRPGITSAQAAERLGKLHPGTVRNLWLKMGLSYKKR